MKAKDVKPRYNFQSRKPYLEEKLLFIPTFYDKHHQFIMPDFASKEIFSQKKPIHVEFCSGNGEWIIKAAQENPEIGWIAVEMKFSRVRKIHAKTRNLHLDNILVVWARGEDFIDHYLPPSSIDAAFVHFPDPWPKTRHAKHRIVQKEFCHKLSLCLKKEGRLYLITDDKTYRDQMIDIVNIDYIPENNKLYESRSHAFNSYFYRLFSAKNKEIFNVQYIKKNQEQIRLELSHEKSLGLESLRNNAQKIVEAGKKICWVFDFGCSIQEMRLFNQAYYASHRLSLERLEKHIFGEFKNHTCEYRLLDSSLSFEKIEPLPLEAFSDFEQFCANHQHPSQFNHFYLGSLVDFLECLGAYLPLDIPRSIHINLQSTLSKAQFAELFSLRNFQDIDVRIQTAPIATQRLLTSRIAFAYKNAFIIPTGKTLDIQRMQKQIDRLEANGVEFCLIPQEYLMDYCCGLQKLFVCKKSLCPDGKRIVDGFLASMGIVEFL